MTKLIKSLDLEEFIKAFKSFLSRDKELFLQGDTKLHLCFIKELESLQFTPPPLVQNLDSQLALLKKFGFLKLDEIFEFVKIVRYFNYLKGLKLEGRLGEWINSIDLPLNILEITKAFLENGSLRSGIYLELDSIVVGIERVKKDIEQSLRESLNSNKLSAYLVDKQVHLIKDCECLLLKPGFLHVIKGQILERSSAGFFYVLPHSVEHLKDKLRDLNNKKEEQLFNICKDISSVFTKHFLFLRFINREFDRFDSYQARLHFARARDLEFLAPASDSKIILCEFAHPALKNPKSINLDFSGQVLMITGVNAGGKTMLLKSILSAVFLSKYLLPLPLNASKSHIGSFKNLRLILEDPQNSKNDISTFGGRMLEFSDILRESGGIVGVDEIELGTDSDEAASLFKVLLESLMQKNNKIIITTHHKRLAALMANNPKVQLLAALFDEAREMPTFSFLSGTIGKSYAFETALRYGIPKTLVKEAKELYGSDKEKLNTLIENSAKLEMQLQDSINKHRQKQEELEKKIINLKDKEISLEKLFKDRVNALEKAYNAAIAEAKNAAKESKAQDIHKGLNSANKLLKEAQGLRGKFAQSSFKIAESLSVKDSSIKGFKAGMRVKYRDNRGVILNLQKELALVELEGGLKIKIPLKELKISGLEKIPSDSKLSIATPQQASVVLDLHGLRAEDALEELDKFISNSLIAGFDEVLIYHGIGTGRLSSVVREFLKTHPKVVGFEDAPPREGGFGAKVVKL
ncbi:MAG: endonuclease MutS2 [Helicobacter sp.]|nr:endonuclease MutS2 [Helicobacteraceae bacterium]MDY3114028.1 endonuclease MutS2 [Helicobacter sp.]